MGNWSTDALDKVLAASDPETLAAIDRALTDEGKTAEQVREQFGYPERDGVACWRQVFDRRARKVRNRQRSAENHVRIMREEARQFEADAAMNGFSPELVAGCLKILLPRYFSGEIDASEFKAATASINSASKAVAVAQENERRQEQHAAEIEKVKAASEQVAKEATADPEQARQHFREAVAEIYGVKLPEQQK